MNNTKDNTHANYPQVDVKTLEEKIVSKVESDEDNVMTTVETRMQNAVLTATEGLVIPTVQLTVKSAIASAGRSVDGNVMEFDQKDFSGNFQGLQLTISSRKNSYTGLNMIETRSNITVEEGDLLVNDRKIDRQTHTHHMVTGENAPQEFPEVLPGHIPTNREPSQTQHIFEQLSRDTT